MINWSGEQEYYSMYYSCGKIFQKILNIQDELKRSYTTCSHPMDISSHLAETVFFSYLFSTNRPGKGFKVSACDLGLYQFLVFDFIFIICGNKYESL